MAQTHGYRDNILAAILLRKKLGVTDFRKHYTDSRSDEHVPFGIRFDMKKLCQLVSLRNQSTYLDSLLVFNSKNMDSVKSWEEYRVVFLECRILG